MTQMLQVNKNRNIKYNIYYKIHRRSKKILYKSASIISDLVTRQMHAYYVAAHRTTQIKNMQNMATFI